MDYINLRPLHVFRTVMKTGTVSGAARILGVTQPAVSKMLKNLEDSAGFALFKRQGGRLYPSKEAERLALEADRLFGHVVSLKETVGALRESREGTLSIAAVPTLAGSLVARAIGKFRKSRPKVKVELRAHTSRQVIEAVTRQEVDLGFVHGNVDDPHINGQFMWETEIVCLMPRRHPLTKHKAIACRDLVNQPLITLGPMSPPSWLIRENFAAARISPATVIETNLTISAYALVEAGAGIAIVDPLAHLNKAYSNVVVRPFRPTIRIRTACFHSAFRPLSGLSQHFIEQLREIVDEISAVSDFIIPLSPGSPASTLPSR
jgi:DNA-binding transcriptional LysR family regulator